MLDPRCPIEEKTRIGWDWDTCTGFGDYHDFWTFYREVVAAAPPNSTIVEVGCYAGRSLTCLAAYSRAANKGLRIVGVDNDGIGGMQSCRQNVARSGLSIELIHAPSVQAAARFTDESCWLVFIDAEHLHDEVERDVRAWMPKVRPGGWLAGHDYRMYTVAEPVNAIFGRDNVIYDERWDDIWIVPQGELRQGVNVREFTTVPELRRPW